MLPPEIDAHTPASEASARYTPALEASASHTPALEASAAEIQTESSFGAAPLSHLAAQLRNSQGDPGDWTELQVAV